jgi:hypothetical protein
MDWKSIQNPLVLSIRLEDCLAALRVSHQLPESTLLLRRRGGGTEGIEILKFDSLQSLLTHYDDFQVDRQRQTQM